MFIIIFFHFLLILTPMHRKCSYNINCVDMYISLCVCIAICVRRCMYEEANKNGYFMTILICSVWNCDIKKNLLQMTCTAIQFIRRMETRIRHKNFNQIPWLKYNSRQTTRNHIIYENDHRGVQLTRTNNTTARCFCVHLIWRWVRNKVK